MCIRDRFNTLEVEAADMSRPKQNIDYKSFHNRSTASELEVLAASKKKFGNTFQAEQILGEKKVTLVFLYKHKENTLATDIICFFINM